MKDRPLASILINNYNYGGFLGDAIESALNQTYSPLEVIVVDDGSTDNSKSVIEAFRGKIKYYLSENRGQASAFNIGFGMSKGEYIFFLDSDDIFCCDKVDRALNIFERNSNKIDWLFHPLCLCDAGLNKIYSPEYPNSEGVFDLSSSIQRGKLRGNLPLEKTATSSICFKRSFLMNILPMPEEIRITSDDYIKYAALGLGKGYIYPFELSVQRIHGSNSYTTLRKDKLPLRAKTMILTAYYLRINFPILKKLCNRLYALGLSLYPEILNEEPMLSRINTDYMSRLSRWERPLIYITGKLIRLKEEASRHV